MIFQNQIQPIKIPTTSTKPVVGILNNTIKLTAFPLDGNLSFYLDSEFRTLKIQEETPDFETPYRIIKPNVAINFTADGIAIDDFVTCGVQHPTSLKLTNNLKRLSVDSPFQVVYFLKEAAIVRLYASVNGGAFREMEFIKILSLDGGGAFLIMNYHTYYQELNLNPFDTVSFKFDKLPFREIVKMDAIYTDYPFHLAVRNQYGFWDCFRFFGSQEINNEFQNNTLESLEELRSVYGESYQKVSLNTGLLEQNEKQFIAQNLQNLDFFEVRDNAIFRLISETKTANVFSSKEYQDNIKLDFRYALTTRKYQ